MKVTLLALRMSEERILLADRSCKVCVKSEVCFAFKALNEIFEKLPTSGMVGTEAPGIRDDVYLALASCCFLFQKKKGR